MMTGILSYGFSRWSDATACVCPADIMREKKPIVWLHGWALNLGAAGKAPMCGVASPPPHCVFRRHGVADSCPQWLAQMVRFPPGVPQ